MGLDQANRLTRLSVEEGVIGINDRERVKDSEREAIFRVTIEVQKRKRKVHKASFKKNTFFPPELHEAA
jgi:hypothetical protein